MGDGRRPARSSGPRRLLGRPIVGTSRGGASDASNLAPHLPLAIDGLGPLGGAAHSPAEHLLVDSLEDRAAVALALAVAVLGRLTRAAAPGCGMMGDTVSKRGEEPGRGAQAGQVGSGEGRSDHGRCPRDRQVHRAGADPPRRPGRDRRSRSRSRRADGGGARRQRASRFELDVTDRESFSRFLDDAEKELGPIDVLINNAGIMPVGPFVEETDETAKTMIDINLHGVIFGTKLALERMLPRGSGHIVNIASQAGKAGLPGGATYCATKHAVVGLSEAVRLENIDKGIEVSCVMPAVVNTELGSGLTDTRGVKKLEPEEVAEAIVEAIETNRFDVWVPKSSAGISVILNLVPRSGREAIARFMKADKVLAEVDEQRARRLRGSRRQQHLRGGRLRADRDEGLRPRPPAEAEPS